MKFTRQLLLTLLALGLSHCASKVALLDAEIVSMSSEKMPGSGAKKGEKVTTQWCMGDEPLIASDDRVYGLIDQVIAKAEKQAGTSHLANVSIYQESSCVYLEGFGLN